MCRVLGLGSLVFIVLPLVVSLPACDGPRERETLANLTGEYLNPAFSDEFLQFWHIEDLSLYRHRLLQEFFLAQSRTEGLAATAGSVDEMLDFSRRLMINWLEEELILRALLLVEFENASESEGYPLVGKDPLDEKVVADELGADSRTYALYQEWLAEVRAGRRL